MLELVGFIAIMYLVYRIGKYDGLVKKVMQEEKKDAISGKSDSTKQDNNQS